MNWWTVVLPGEYAETSELYGLYRSEAAAQKAADKWNSRKGADEDPASVLPIAPAASMPTPES